MAGRYFDPYFQSLCRLTSSVISFLYNKKIKRESPGAPLYCRKRAHTPLEPKVNVLVKPVRDSYKANLNMTQFCWGKQSFSLSKACLPCFARGNSIRGFTPSLAPHSIWLNRAQQLPSGHYKYNMLLRKHRCNKKIYFLKACHREGWNS